MKTKFITLWILWSLFGVLLIFGVSYSDSSKSILAIVAMALSFSPLLGLMLALGSPKATNQIIDWIKKTDNAFYYIAGGLTTLFALPGLLMGSFDPYNTIIFIAIVITVFGVLKQNYSKEFKLNWSDIALWLLLWIPFDFRWYDGLQPNLDYSWWSVAISVIAVIGWLGCRGANIGYNLIPKFKDLKVTAIALTLILAVIIPPGLLTGFLTFSIPESYDIPYLTAHFIGLFLTVALPEELFFRGILLKGLEKVSTKKWIPLMVSSFAFGLMHWNNINGLAMQITYISLASIAGLGYAWAYKKSGNNLFAAILVHTLVDWLWKLFLAG